MPQINDEANPSTVGTYLVDNVVRTPNVVWDMLCRRCCTHTECRMGHALSTMLYAHRMSYGTYLVDNVVRTPNVVWAYFVNNVVRTPNVVWDMLCRRCCTLLIYCRGVPCVRPSSRKTFLNHLTNRVRHYIFKPFIPYTKQFPHYKRIPSSR